MVVIVVVVIVSGIKRVSSVFLMLLIIIEHAGFLAQLATVLYMGQSVYKYLIMRTGITTIAVVTSRCPIK